jgi:predicted nuclease of predicted toxin-antitoxin system
MRLLLDEYFSPEIARRLRARGHDLAVVAERTDLVGLSDEELFWRMAQEERAIMTNNVKDFVPLANRAAVNGEDHFGLVLTSDKRMPRRLDAIGLVVEAVDEFLGRYQAKEGCRNQVRWLSAPSR